MRFSQRMGHRPIKNVLQIESMDDDLKNGLWNLIYGFIETHSDDRKNNKFSPKESFLRNLWQNFFKGALDDMPSSPVMGGFSSHATIKHIRDWYYQTEWFQIYDLVEFIIPYHNDLQLAFNSILTKEVAAYRVVDGKVTQITSEGEIAEIEEAISSSDQWKSVNIHLTAALDFLADRKNPDYRNSIKESISAVESLCLKIGGNANGKFGDALTEIDKKVNLHGSLKRAFTALYGYTSDAGGIRHALIDDDTTPTFEDAKFMLVSCSAFINYLKAKMQL